MANIENINFFLEREYVKNAQILRNGDLFSSVQREVANVGHTIENMEVPLTGEKKTTYFMFLKKG